MPALAPSRQRSPMRMISLPPPERVPMIEAPPPMSVPSPTTTPAEMRPSTIEVPSVPALKLTKPSCMTVVPGARCAPRRTRSASAMRTPDGHDVVGHPRELVDAVDGQPPAGGALGERAARRPGPAGRGRPRSRPRWRAGRRCRRGWPRAAGRAGGRAGAAAGTRRRCPWAGRPSEPIVDHDHRSQPGSDAATRRPAARPRRVRARRARAGRSGGGRRGRGAGREPGVQHLTGGGDGGQAESPGRVVTWRCSRLSATRSTATASTGYCGIR